MRLYTSQHPYYCGIDLHARSMYVACSTRKARCLSIATFRQRARRSRRSSTRIVGRSSSA